MSAWDIDPEMQAQAAARKRGALAQIEVGATYRHRGAQLRYGKWDREDIVVTDVNEGTGYVSWRSATGPGLADIHRTMYCINFVKVYTAIFHRRR